MWTAQVIAILNDRNENRLSGIAINMAAKGLTTNGTGPSGVITFG